MLCSIKPKTCSTLTLTFDFMLLLAFYFSVSGLPLNPFSWTLFLTRIFFITFFCFTPVYYLYGYNGCSLTLYSSKWSNACESWTYAYAITNVLMTCFWNQLKHNSNIRYISPIFPLFIGHQYLCAFFLCWSFHKSLPSPYLFFLFSSRVFSWSGAKVKLASINFS